MSCAPPPKTLGTLVTSASIWTGMDFREATCDTCLWEHEARDTWTPKLGTSASHELASSSDHKG